MKLFRALRVLATTAPEGCDRSTDGILVDPHLKSLVVGNGTIAVILPVKDGTPLPDKYALIPTDHQRFKELDLAEALAHATPASDWGHGNLKETCPPTAGTITLDADQLETLANLIRQGEEKQVTLHIPASTSGYPVPMLVTRPGASTEEGHGFLVIAPDALSGFQTASAASPAAAAGKREATPETDAPPTLDFDAERGWIKLLWDGKPAAAVRSIMKQKRKGCFVFHRTEHFWFTKDKPAARTVAAEVFAHYGLGLPDCPPLTAAAA